MSLSTTPAEVLLEVATGLPQLQEVSLCYGEMSDAAAAAAGWSALPIRSLVSLSGCSHWIANAALKLGITQCVACFVVISCLETAAAGCPVAPRPAATADASA
jgi:hypothetical protein